MNESNYSLQTSIASAVKKSLRPVCLVPLTAAVFFSSYSYAIGLQDIQIKSNLGEPLNATVMLTNPPAGTLSSNCFRVLPKSSGADFPGIASASASLSRVSGGYAVNIRSSELVKEPITSITLATNCSALPVIERTYTMMIDPAGIYEERVAQAVYTPRNNTRLATSLDSNRTQVITRPVAQVNQSSIAQNSRYQIQRGDSLSSIASRVQNTPTNSTWSVAASILATNPSAFINNNPDYIVQGNTIAIPSFTSSFVPNERAALNLITGNSRNFEAQQITPSGVVASTSSATTQQQNAPAEVRYVPVQDSNQALSTMTLSTSLSALSLERIEARANGQVISDSLLPNTSSLFGSGEEENQRNPQQTAAVSPKQVVEPKVVYVDRPAYPSEIDQRINAGISEGLARAESESASSFSKLVTSLVATLIGLGLLSWFVVRPFIKRRNRIAFIRSVRAHKKKSKYISRNRQRKSVLNRLPAQKSILSTEIEEITNTFSETTPDIRPERTPFELEQHAKEIEAAFTASKPALTPTKKPDSQAVINKNNGPREPKVAKEIYEVGTIDDTGELASLTMAFPELEAELNARLGGKIPDLGKDIEDKNAETLTVQFERPLEDVVDFELPGLLDNVEGDFEAVVKEGDFASTMVFNEEIFKEGETLDPFEEETTSSQTISTEGIDADGETRVSEIMIDEDGLKPSDFGLDDEDFPVDKKEYSYLEPDASINTPGLNLSAEELEELGFEDDTNNIVPFAKIKQGKK